MGCKFKWQRNPVSTFQRVCYIDAKNLFEGRNLTKKELFSFFFSVSQILEGKKYSFFMSFPLQIEHFSAWLILPKPGVIQTALVKEFRNFSVQLFKVKSFYFCRLSKQTPRVDINSGRYRILAWNRISYKNVYSMIYKIGIKIGFSISSFF